MLLYLCGRVAKKIVINLLIRVWSFLAIDDAIDITNFVCKYCVIGTYLDTDYCLQGVKLLLIYV